MIIDASLGRSGCCGYPSCTPQPPSPPSCQPAAPPCPLTEPDAVQVVLAAAQTGVASGAAIPLAGAVRQIGNGLSFDSTNHAVIVNEPGVYTFNWQVLVQIGGDGTDAVITLESLDGQTILGRSGVPAAVTGDGALITGSAVAALPAGTAWILVNSSAAALDIPVVGTAPNTFSAAMTVSEVGSSNLAQQGAPQNGKQSGCGCGQQSNAPQGCVSGFGSGYNPFINQGFNGGSNQGNSQMPSSSPPAPVY